MGNLLMKNSSPFRLTGVKVPTWCRAPSHSGGVSRRVSPSLVQANEPSYWSMNCGCHSSGRLRGVKGAQCFVS